MSLTVRRHKGRFKVGTTFTKGTVMDYPLVRAQNKCVACGETAKPTGLLLHWRCHDKQKARNSGDYSRRVYRALSALEYQLRKAKGGASGTHSDH